MSTMNTMNQINATAKFMYPCGGEPGSSVRSENFGIYRMVTEQQPTQFNSIWWVLSVDRSGSMSDQCPDGKTKMEHIHHTIRNMLAYFIKLSGDTSTLTQYLTIVAFDHEATTVCHNREVNDSLVADMDTILSEMVPRGATNFEKALEVAAVKIRALMNVTVPTGSKYQVSHIFMSDGRITRGIDNRDCLKRKMLNLCGGASSAGSASSSAGSASSSAGSAAPAASSASSVTGHIVPTHSFIGFGAHHDAKLMRELSDVPKGEYYFIDSLENAGMVYGEVLYNSLYEYVNNLTVNIVNGEIYDYKTGTWIDELKVHAIASGQTRTWHIRRVSTTEKPAGNTDVGYESAEVVDIPTSVRVVFDPVGSGGAEEERVSLDDVVVEYHDGSGHGIDKEVEKYLWRQKTQNIMMVVNKYISQPDYGNDAEPHGMLYPGALGTTATHPDWGTRGVRMGRCMPLGRGPHLYPNAHVASKTPVGCGAGAKPGLNNNEVLSKPLLLHNNLYPRRVSAPPPSPDKTADRWLDEQHQILDMAKHRAWSTVWGMLDLMPHLITSMPYPRRFNLIHHAIDQENVKALEILMSRGGSTTEKTLDNLSPEQLVKKSSVIISGAMSALLAKYVSVAAVADSHVPDSHVADSHVPDSHEADSHEADSHEADSRGAASADWDIPRTKDEYIAMLDRFMTEMKQYMLDNNLEDDEFMKNLCDDIYVCTKSLTSTANIGNMYLNTRSSSQGNERAYNVQNFNVLDEASSPIGAAFRGLCSHRTSTNTQTAYSSRGAARLMRTVSASVMPS